MDVSNGENSISSADAGTPSKFDDLFRNFFHRFKVEGNLSNVRRHLDIIWTQDEPIAAEILKNFEFKV